MSADLMPQWFTALRPHQEVAIDEALWAFRQGVRMVLIDAPTGSGKTVIGEVVRQRLGVPALYVCHGLELQDQFVRDFNAPVLKGRSNYPTERFGWDVTADNCQGARCNLCTSKTVCDYEQAKNAAIAGSPAVLNTTYYLTEANGPGRMRGRELVVIDEADTLESELMRWSEFRISRRAAQDLRLTIPRKGTHWPKIHEWLGEYARRVSKKAHDMQALEPAEARKLRSRAEQIYRHFPAGCDGDNWVREYNQTNGLILKPVRVDGMGRDHLWRHGGKHMLMSATLIGPEFMLRDLGWDEDFHVVKVPMTFPVENRRVYVLPVATMTAKGKEQGEWVKMKDAIGKLIAKHRGQRILVHTVSYELAGYLHDALGGITYVDSASRNRALSEYRNTEGAVLFAPSMDRGVDLPGDLCRVQIIAKLPYPYLGDKRVSTRLHTDGGQVWYNLQTIRSLVQMTGRGVRSADDWAVTYLLDRQFVTNYHRYKPLVPDWWHDSLVMDRRPQDVLNTED
jgi:ATP-dependent DNA helicase DinG